MKFPCEKQSLHRGEKRSVRLISSKSWIATRMCGASLVINVYTGAVIREVNASEEEGNEHATQTLRLTEKPQSLVKFL